MNSVADRAFQRITDVNSRYWASLFFGLLFVYVALLISEALGYSSAPRLFPMVIGVPLLLLIVVQVVLLLFQEQLGIESVDLFESIQQLEETTEGSDDEAAVERARREFEMIVLSILSFVLIWLVGHMVALVVFVFGFIYLYERNLTRALLATALTFGFIYLLFVVILGASLYEGALGGMLP